MFICKGVSWYKSMKFKVLLVFIYTKQNFSRELEIDVSYLASLLYEKSFQICKQFKKKWKARKIYTRIYTHIYKKYKKCIHAFKNNNNCQ